MVFTKYALISILCMQVCVPIDPENAENFDPVDGVPTVSQLLTDLDQSDIKQSTADMQVSRASMSSGQFRMQNMSVLTPKPDGLGLMTCISGMLAIL